MVTERSIAAFDHWAMPVELSAQSAAASAGLADHAVQNHAVAVDSIELSFGGVKALSGVDLAVRKGDIHAIIGPNGAGKSSLLNVIGGLYQPDRGRVWIA